MKCKKIKEEDEYVNDYEIRTYSDCHPSTAVRVFTKGEILKMIENVAENFHCECSADEEGIDLCKIHEFSEIIKKQIKDGNHN